MIGCGGIELLILFGLVGLVAIQVLLAVWIYRDATEREMDSPVLWLIVVLVATVIGLIVYLIVRPDVHLVGCPSCHKRRIAGSATCPHCGNA